MKPKPTSEAAATLGSLGGHARARKLSAAARSASAKKAALARWANHRKLARQIGHQEK